MQIIERSYISNQIQSVQLKKKTLSRDAAQTALKHPPDPIPNLGFVA